ncbi:hypothetical protein CFP65_0157 [Kitasatospora sp. MMS16-BH015]|uniref:PASTA domain-containing protein n=1 Tax=Kitasatospora sp. MMS16-BH015 TaxID=2018025 RepID=UPI000CA21ED3|nr:PASTA domain-containing protein [Kitasatospora sp. MMS16-BH015]AUG75140.1 hypothetical protein CFP65_0157 [Kitasatospora sp. MMS16-BH015]
MTWLGPENARLVRVPDVVGLEIDAAREVAGKAGVVLAPPDPDGPSLRALTWPGQWTVTAQHPAPGSAMRYRGSLVVEFRPGAPVDAAPDSPPPGDTGGGESGDREPRLPKPSPGALGAEREGEAVSRSGE